MTSIANDIEKVVDWDLPLDRIIGGLKRIIVKQGKENEFESLFTDLVARVRKHDKGCNYYDLYKSELPRNYLVMEQYENRDALQRHQDLNTGSITFQRFENY